MTELARFVEELRLTLYEKEIILYLSTVDMADARAIYKNSKVPQGRIYSVLQELKQKGFVEITPTKPKKYQIKNIKESLKQYLKQKQDDLQEKIIEVKDLEIKPKSFLQEEKAPSVNFYYGREEHLKAVVTLRENAKKELLQMAPLFAGHYASMLSVQRALKRGVKMKILVWNITAKNKKQIRNCITNGGEIRKSTAADAFSIVIKDSSETLIGVQDFRKKEERLVVHTQNPSLIKALRDTFFRLWRQATPITKKDL
jgi:sugar-specific transcriptional regulator TrmB